MGYRKQHRVADGTVITESKPWKGNCLYFHSWKVRFAFSVQTFFTDQNAKSANPSEITFQIWSQTFCISWNAYQICHHKSNHCHSLWMCSAWAESKKARLRAPQQKCCRRWPTTQHTPAEQRGVHWQQDLRHWAASLREQVFLRSPTGDPLHNCRQASDSQLLTSWVNPEQESRPCHICLLAVGMVTGRSLSRSIRDWVVVRRRRRIQDRQRLQTSTLASHCSHTSVYMLATSIASMSTGVTTHFRTVRAWTPGQHPTTLDCCMSLTKQPASSLAVRTLAPTQTWPSRVLARTADCQTDVSVRKFLRSPHRPSLITPPGFKVPAHSKPVKCWKFCQGRLEALLSSHRWIRGEIATSGHTRYWEGIPGFLQEPTFCCWTMYPTWPSEELCAMLGQRVRDPLLLLYLSPSGDCLCEKVVPWLNKHNDVIEWNFMKIPPPQKWRVGCTPELQAHHFWPSLCSFKTVVLNQWGASRNLWCKPLQGLQHKKILSINLPMNTFVFTAFLSQGGLGTKDNYLREALWKKG